MFLLNFRRPTWQRAGIALLLAFLATTIVKPYFLPFVTVGQLLTRMAVTATVMPLAPMLAAYRERFASNESTDLAAGLEELSQPLGLPTRNTCVGLRTVPPGRTAASHRRCAVFSVRRKIYPRRAGGFRSLDS